MGVDLWGAWDGVRDGWEGRRRGWSEGGAGREVETEGGDEGRRREAGGQSAGYQQVKP